MSALLDPVALERVTARLEPTFCRLTTSWPSGSSEAGLFSDILLGNGLGAGKEIWSAVSTTLEVAEWSGEWTKLQEVGWNLDLSDPLRSMPPAFSVRYE
jgi:hypothetical protein